MPRALPSTSLSPSPAPPLLCGPDDDEERAAAVAGVELSLASAMPPAVSPSGTSLASILSPGWIAGVRGATKELIVRWFAGRRCDKLPLSPHV